MDRYVIKLIDNESCLNDPYVGFSHNRIIEVSERMCCSFTLDDLSDKKLHTYLENRKYCLIPIEKSIGGRYRYL